MRSHRAHPSLGAPFLLGETMGETVSLDNRTQADIVEKEYDDEQPVYPYFGVTSFSELEDLQESQIAAKRVHELGEMFQYIAGNIMADPEIDNKASALSALVNEYATRLDTLEGAQTKESDKPESLPAEPANAFTVWKEASGAWRWLAIYSNKFRDADNPPEIISEKSHKTFVDMVDKGLVPYPELWHWHIPGSRWGVADWLEYADGFALASGTVDAGHEKEAANLAASTVALRVSHGMPEKFIWRNAADPSVIDFHITKEISPLPSPAAANPLTGFELFMEDKDMALSKDKRDYLANVAGLPEDAIARIESGLASKAKEAADAGLEFKETEATEELVAEVTAEPAVDAPAPAQPEPVADAPVMRAELAEVMAEFVGAFTEQLRTLTGNVDTLATAVKELQSSDAEKIAAKAADTPPASLAALISERVMNHAAAKVDGRSTLAKSKPAETEPVDVNGPTPFSFINSLVDASHNGQTQ